MINFFLLEVKKLLLFILAVIALVGCVSNQVGYDSRRVLSPTLINALSPDIEGVNEKQMKVDKNYSEKRIQELIQSAESGDANMQVVVGQYYIDGSRGFEKNYSKGKYFLQKAALQGNSGGQSLLANIYATKEGNEAEAFKWFKKAADQNSAKNQMNVGSRYLLGLGTEENIYQGLSYLKLAAQNNDKSIRAKELKELIKMLNIAYLDYYHKNKVTPKIIRCSGTLTVSNNRNSSGPIDMSYIIFIDDQLKILFTSSEGIAIGNTVSFDENYIQINDIKNIEKNSSTNIMIDRRAGIIQTQEKEYLGSGNVILYYFNGTGELLQDKNQF
jgi:hypothetical protein